MSKVLSVLSSVKNGLVKVYGVCPFGFGVALGYFCRPEIKVVVDLAAGVVKGLLKL